MSSILACLIQGMFVSKITLLFIYLFIIYLFKLNKFDPSKCKKMCAKDNKVQKYCYVEILARRNFHYFFSYKKFTGNNLHYWLVFQFMIKKLKQSYV